ncbi:MAG TPA: Gmad2 immunoglobulin-like domain-containing protein [Nocardioidaceae bacterium]|nr:Gmad2 immunoglobulin-like domain-containing protein [Nocardioidaceae bacterium]
MVKQFTGPGRGGDEFEDRVREALRRDAEQVEPAGDGLREIRRRTALAARGSRRRWMVTGAAGLATAAAVAGAVVVSGNLVEPTAAPGPAVAPATTDSPTAPAPSEAPTPTLSPLPGNAEPTPTPTPSTQEPNETPEAQKQTAPPAPVVQEMTVPVYYLGGTTNGQRLFREFHAVRTSDPRAVAALNQMLGQRAADDDYTSPWAAGSRARSVEQAAGQITVDLSGEALATSVPRQTADLMVQQLVYTVQAALQSTDPVRILVDGEQVSEISGSPVSAPVARADQLLVQALTWVTTPFEGATVGRTFRVEGVANAFEATVSWQLLDGRRVVKEGFATAAEGMAFSPYSFRVRNVAPGEYTLKAYQQSAEDGSETFVDTKAITVK